MNWLLNTSPLLRHVTTATPADHGRDVVAGLTTAIMLIPQGMAYAMLAGLDPIVGLYASTVPVVLYALLGTSRQLAVGPVAMISLLVASGVAPLAGGDPVVYLALAGLLALMVGVMQFSMGMLRLGFLVRFLSHPVIAGFTSAAALIIGFSQLKHALGIDIPRSHHLYEIMGHALSNIADVHPLTVGLTVGSVVTLIVLKRFAPRFPRFLLVVAVSTVAVWALGLDAAGVAIVGAVPSGLPAPSLPSVSLQSLYDLLPIAITISLVAFMESISVARSFARRGGYEVNADQELRGLGLANMGSSFIGGYPVTGGFSRTAVNGQAGARSGLAGLVTAVVVGLTLLFLTPLFHYLPKAVLAAIIMTAVVGLIDIAEARHLYRISRPDLALMIITFIATLGLGIEQGIMLGVAASLLWFIWKVSRPHMATLGQLPDSNIFRDVQRYPEAHDLGDVLAIRIDAPLFFANTAFIKQHLEEQEAKMTRPIHGVIIDGKGIGTIDAAGDRLLHDLVDDYHKRDVEVWFAALHGNVRDVLRASGLLEKVGEDHAVERVCHAVEFMNRLKEPVRESA
ncbi:MAG: SulP family sulfate permease [Kiritimatiellia bacterium]